MTSQGGPVRLDGSKGEGGGQILRTALTLSMLTGRPLRIDRIRANRDKPGLRPQHLLAVEAAARLCHADCRGAEIGSSTLDFRPGPIDPRDLELSIGTAGATALVLHTLALPIALRAEQPARLVLNGGTFNTRAPSYPFLTHTWAPLMSSLGLRIAVAMPRAGFYPRGGGRLEAWIEPGQLRPLVIDERGPLQRVDIQAGTSRLPRHVAERMASRARHTLAVDDFDLAPEAEPNDWPADSPGAAISLIARHEHFTATFVGLGERGKPAETVADEALAELLDYETRPGALDPHSADQILLPLALAAGTSAYTVTHVTEHLRTNAATIRAFLDRSIRIEEPDAGGDTPGRVLIN